MDQFGEMIAKEKGRLEMIPHDPTGSVVMFVYLFRCKAWPCTNVIFVSNIARVDMHPVASRLTKQKACNSNVYMLEEPSTQWILFDLGNCEMHQEVSQGVKTGRRLQSVCNTKNL